MRFCVCVLQVRPQQGLGQRSAGGRGPRSRECVRGSGQPSQVLLWTERFPEGRSVSAPRPETRTGREILQGESQTGSWKLKKEEVWPSICAFSINFHVMLFLFLRMQTCGVTPYGSVRSICPTSCHCCRRSTRRRRPRREFGEFSVPERLTTVLPWHPRLNLSHFTCPTHKEPMENVWKWVALKKNELVRWLDKPCVCEPIRFLLHVQPVGNSSRANQISDLKYQQFSYTN